MVYHLFTQVNILFILENTLEGLLAALPVADYVEFDVVLNKDLDLLICHDTFLSRLSDIINYP